MADIGLAVLDREPTRLEQLAGPVGELDLDDRVAAAVGDEGPGRRRSASEGSQPSTIGTKPLKARIPATGGRSAPSAIA